MENIQPYAWMSGYRPVLTKAVNKSKPLLTKGWKTYDKGSRAVLPFFSGEYGGRMGKQIGDALEVSGADVNPDKFKTWGTRVGTVAPLIPGSGVALTGLFNADAGNDLLSRYGVPNGYGKVDGVTGVAQRFLETVDPFNAIAIPKDPERRANYYMSYPNVPYVDHEQTSLWDRLKAFGNDPRNTIPLVQIYRDSIPLLRMPYIRDVYEKGATELVGQGMKNLGHNLSPEGYEYIRSIIHESPVNDWAKDMGESLLPWNWVEPVKQWWKDIQE